MKVLNKFVSKEVEDRILEVLNNPPFAYSTMEFLVNKLGGENRGKIKKALGGLQDKGMVQSVKLNKVQANGFVLDGDIVTKSEVRDLLERDDIELYRLTYSRRGEDLDIGMG